MTLPMQHSTKTSVSLHPHQAATKTPYIQYCVLFCVFLRIPPPRTHLGLVYASSSVCLSISVPIHCPHNLTRQNEGAATTPSVSKQHYSNWPAAYCKKKKKRRACLEIKTLDTK